MGEESDGQPMLSPRDGALISCDEPLQQLHAHASDIHHEETSDVLLETPLYSRAQLDDARVGRRHRGTGRLSLEVMLAFAAFVFVATRLPEYVKTWKNPKVDHLLVDFFSNSSIRGQMERDLKNASSTLSARKPHAKTSNSSTRTSNVSVNAEGWMKERIGRFRNLFSGECATVPADSERNLGSFAVSMTKCDYRPSAVQQQWTVDEYMGGYIRNFVEANICLDIAGNPGWKSGSRVQARSCNYSDRQNETDQIWKLDGNGFIVNRLSGKCLSVDTPQNKPADLQLEDTPQNKPAVLQLEDCMFDTDSKQQQWVFLELDDMAEISAKSGQRPGADIDDESVIRSESSTVPGVLRLTFADVAEAMDPTFLLDGDFWQLTRNIFANMTPAWNDWNRVIDMVKNVRRENQEQTALGSAFLTNFVSNVIFASSNFVQGFTRPNIEFMGNYHLEVQNFAEESENEGCNIRTFNNFMSFCMWPKPKTGIPTGIVSAQDFIRTKFQANLPDHTFFETIYTGENVPPWEDDRGLRSAFKLLESGIQTAREFGIEPIESVRASSEERFAFDAEGLQALHEIGFGFPADYRSGSLSGAAAVENLLRKYGAGSDVLGVLMTETVLSSHLTFNGSHFIADCTNLEKYEALPGYAKLGGRALFEERDGRLATVSLKYDGKTFTSFDDEQSEADYKRSKLSGWHFAEKAIIASLLVKTELLVHVKQIHLEIAPVLQAVTVDAFADNLSHPLRRMLEPFVSRGIQATASNLQLWFQMRAGEFGLAPLAMEEQLKLLHDSFENEPLNLAELDMDRFAEVRGMKRFTADKEGRWNWKWYQRASKMQTKFEQFVECWLSKNYPQDELLLQDPFLIAWWTSLVEHMPALQSALLHVLQQSTSVPPTSGPPTTPPPTSGPPTTRPPTSGTPTSTTSLPSTPALTNPPTERSKQGSGTNFGHPFKPKAETIAQTTTPFQTSVSQEDASAGQSVQGVPHWFQPIADAVANAEKGNVDVKSGSGTRSDKPTWFDPTANAPTSVSDAAPTNVQNASPQWFAPESPNPSAQQVLPAEPSVQSTTSAGFYGVAQLHPDVPSPASPPGMLKTWRRLSISEVSRVPLPDRKSLVQILRTLMLWVSWIHEDVGHAAATFIHNPVYTPIFVPKDGIGIPIVPYTLAVAAYRNFVFLKRPTLLDAPPDHWFDEHKICKKKLIFLKSCDEPARDKQCYVNLQENLKGLAANDVLFKQCGQNHFYSCVHDVETSAST